MAQPPDDRRPMPWETPGEPPPEEQPTVAWTPPEEPVPQSEEPATKPVDPGAPVEPAAPLSPPGEAAPGATATGWDIPPTAPPASPGTTPPDGAGQNPLISATPTAPAVAWAAPQTTMTDVAPGLVVADTPSRFVAFVIDIVLLGILGSIIGAVLGWGDTLPTTVDGSFDYTMALASPEMTILGTVIGALYFIGSWSGGRRATLGQMLFKIQVGNAFDGAPLTLGQAIRRWLGLGEFLSVFALVPALAIGIGTLQFVWWIVLLVTTATSPTRQGLHDKFANSALVRPAGAGNGLATACLIVAIVLVGLAFLSFIALIFVGGQASEILEEVGRSI